MATSCLETGGSYTYALGVLMAWMILEGAWLWLLHRTCPPGPWRALLAAPAIAVRWKAVLPILKLSYDAVQACNCSCERYCTAHPATTS